MGNSAAVGVDELQQKEAVSDDFAGGSSGESDDFQNGVYNLFRLLHGEGSECNIDDGMDHLYYDMAFVAIRQDDGEADVARQCGRSVSFCFIGRAE